MRYINGLHEGETIRNVYLCKGKRSAETRNGKPYDNLILQDNCQNRENKRDSSYRGKRQTKCML